MAYEPLTPEDARRFFGDDVYNLSHHAQHTIATTFLPRRSRRTLQAPSPMDPIATTEGGCDEKNGVRRRRHFVPCDLLSFSLSLSTLTEHSALPNTEMNRKYPSSLNKAKKTVACAAFSSVSSNGKPL